jgi:hypothetical protein
MITLVTEPAHRINRILDPARVRLGTPTLPSTISLLHPIHHVDRARPPPSPIRTEEPVATGPEPAPRCYCSEVEESMSP